MTRTLFNADECTQLSEYGREGELIMVLGIEGNLSHFPAMYDGYHWVALMPACLEEGGEMDRYEPEQITAWRPAHIAVGVDAGLLTK